MKKKKVSIFNTNNRSTQRSWVCGIFLSFCCDINCKPATIPGIKFKKTMNISVMMLFKENTLALLRICLLLRNVLETLFLMAMHISVF